jgi:hypothetical protein
MMKSAGWSISYLGLIHSFGSGRLSTSHLKVKSTKTKRFIWGLNSDQLDLILGKNFARLLRNEPKPSAPKTMDITQI